MVDLVQIMILKYLELNSLEKCRLVINLVRIQKKDWKHDYLFLATSICQRMILDYNNSGIDYRCRLW